MTDAERLKVICDDVRKELTQNVRSWKRQEWAQRFAPGLLARGVIAPHDRQTDMRLLSVAPSPHVGALERDETDDRKKRADGRREAQAMTKIGRPRIIETPAETERLVEEYVTKCHDGLGHRETPKRKG